MTAQPIVSSLDFARLQPLITGGFVDAAVLRLRAFLDQARKVVPRRVPPDVVTMNSRVLVLHPGDEAPDSYELAYPDSETGGRSVLSPLGAALLGAREGDSVECAGGRVSRRVIVVCAKMVEWGASIPFAVGTHDAMIARVGIESPSPHQDI